MASTTALRHIPGLKDHDLLQLLGEGGMGQVFLARQRRSGEMVVVKTIHAHLVSDPKVRLRFQQEIDLMRRFRHPNAVALLSAAPPEAELPFFIMEFMRGVTLDDLLHKNRRFTPLRAGCFLAPLCLFLQAAHDHGLLHRDLTPANIMVLDANTAQEDIKVMDFGLARRIGFYIPAGQLQNDGCAIDGGTPDYICPEQILGRQVDHRGDLFSVGVLLYGLLTGHLPYETISEPKEILLANLELEPPGFKHWNVFDIPPAIEKLVLGLMSKNPADRPTSARALVEAYQKVVGHQFVDAKAFKESQERSVSTLRAEKRFDPSSVVDYFEASMLEQVAAMKLRGFVDGVGGAVADSDAGVIKVELPRAIAVEMKKSAWNWFGPTVTQEIEWIAVELHMIKKNAGTRDMVEITVVRPLPSMETVEEKKVRTQFCEHYCRELRAYLMVGG
jgi:eukaryotic-like serine/threonine-protein kinase